MTYVLTNPLITVRYYYNISTKYGTFVNDLYVAGIFL